MKAPDAQANWSKLREIGQDPGYPRKIVLDNVFNHSLEFEIPSPVSVLFGLNGAGKTRILRGLSALVPGSKIVEINNLINYMQQDLAQREDILGLIEETAPLKLSALEDVAIRDIVRRDYDEVNWYAVSIADSPFSGLVDDDVVPVFQVSYAGSSYDFREMGLGELSAHLLLWLLSYGQASRTMLLMDEPEAFLPTPSRESILAYILDASLRGSYPILLASHSLELIQPAIEADAAVLVTETEHRVTLVGPSEEIKSRVAGIYRTGIGTVRRIFVCEDESAFVLSREYLKAFAPAVWQESCFLWCNGFGDLSLTWQHLPRPTKLPSGLPEIVFIADGDKLKEVARLKSEAGKDAARRWKFHTLPDDPDVLYKRYAEVGSDRLSRIFGIPAYEFTGFLESIKGREPHDWVKDVLKRADTTTWQEGLGALAEVTVDNSHDDIRVAEFIALIQGLPTGLPR